MINGPINIIVCVVNHHLCESIVLVLNQQPEFKIIGTHKPCSSISDFLLLKAHIILLDVTMGNQLCCEKLKYSKNVNSKLKIIIISPFDEMVFHNKLIAKGAFGIVYSKAGKNVLVKEIIKAYGQ